jgi:hypothetical protein
VIHYPASHYIVIKMKVRRGYGFFVGHNYAGSADVTGLAFKYFPGSKLAKLEIKNLMKFTKNDEGKRGVPRANDNYLNKVALRLKEANEPAHVVLGIVDFRVVQPSSGPDNVAIAAMCTTIKEYCSNDMLETIANQIGFIGNALSNREIVESNSKYANVVGSTLRNYLMGSLNTLLVKKRVTKDLVKQSGITPQNINALDLYIHNEKNYIGVYLRLLTEEAARRRIILFDQVHCARAFLLE